MVIRKDMFTHTFEIVVNGISINGEISFNGGNPPTVKIIDGFEMELHELKTVTDYLEQLCRICRDCGPIHKIEINEK